MNVSPQEPLNHLDAAGEMLLTSHLNRIGNLIRQEALQIAKDRDASSPESLDVAEAAKKFAPGIRFPDEPSFSERIKSSLSGITVVSALLAILFGIFAVVHSYQTKDGTSGAAYFDIVKIFAGAIVGSTGAGVALRGRRK